MKKIIFFILTILIIILALFYFDSVELFFKGKQYTIQALYSFLTVIAIIVSLITSYMVYIDKRAVLKVNSLNINVGHTTKGSVKEILLNIQNLTETEVKIYKYSFDFNNINLIIKTNETIDKFNIKDIIISLDLKNIKIENRFKNSFKLIIFTNLGTLEHKLSKYEYKDIKFLLEYKF